MAVGFSGKVFLIIVHLLLDICINHTTLGQDVTQDPVSTTSDPNAGPDLGPGRYPVPDPDSVPGPIPAVADKDDFESTFLEPQTINENVDVFVYEEKEYLFVDMRVMHDFAEMMCEQYSATLAPIPNLDLANFLAIALSETNLEFESLWVGGKKNNNDTWYWITDDDNYSTAISSEILGLIANKEAAAEFDRNCLGFARAHHENPQFKNLNCMVERAFMCERPHIADGGNNSTHSGWILIGNRLFKIFGEKVDYHTADINCFNANSNASLAVVDDVEVIKQLGRYLLIGRPSLENAWIGARWINGKYQFEADTSIALDNNTNEVGFPPWRKNTMQRIGGCLLLDRHLSDQPLFIEARCQRLRPYICSRPAFDIIKKENYTKHVFEERIYHAYFNMLPWDAARKICLGDGGKLAEPENDGQVKELLYIMGQNISTVDHMWLGGKYVSQKWIWDYTGGTVDLPFFIKNNTFIERLESMNTCLNLDRENHITGLIYGTNCYYPQHFTCQLKNPS